MRDLKRTSSKEAKSELESKEISAQEESKRKLKMSLTIDLLRGSAQKTSYIHKCLPSYPN